LLPESSRSSNKSTASAKTGHFLLHWLPTLNVAYLYSKLFIYKHSESLRTYISLRYLGLTLMTFIKRTKVTCSKLFCILWTSPALLSFLLYLPPRYFRRIKNYIHLSCLCTVAFEVFTTPCRSPEVQWHFTEHDPYIFVAAEYTKQVACKRQVANTLCVPHPPFSTYTLWYWRWRRNVTPKCWYSSTALHGVTSQKTVHFLFTQNHWTTWKQIKE
jgi:hypothetical protein